MESDAVCLASSDKDWDEEVGQSLFLEEEDIAASCICFRNDESLVL